MSKACILSEMAIIFTLNNLQAEIQKGSGPFDKFHLPVFARFPCWAFFFFFALLGYISTEVNSLVLTVPGQCNIYILDQVQDSPAL